MRELKKRLAKILIERSYREGDFTLASGRKSDYYFDCRQTRAAPRRFVAHRYAVQRAAGRSGHQGHRGMTLAPTR